MASTSHPEMWMPGRSSETRPTEVNRDVLELERRQPAGRVGAGGVERHVPEVEQARVADDDVQAERHHREDEHDDHRARPRDEVADERQLLQRLDDERIDEAEQR